LPIEDLEAMMDVTCGSIRRDDSCPCAAVFARNALHGNEMAVVAAARSQSLIRETTTGAS
jgi:hypothetical protein